MSYLRISFSYVLVILLDLNWFILAWLILPNIDLFAAFLLGGWEITA